MSRAEQLRLFAEHEQSALKIARGMRRKIPTTVTTDDLESAARLGLWDAIARGKNISPQEFSWYLRTRVRGSIIDELRRHDWLPRRQRHSADPCSVVYLESLSDWEQECVLLDSRTTDPELALGLRWKAHALERALLELEPRNRTIMRLILSGMSQLEVSAKIGVSAPRISQIVTSARRHLAESVRLHLSDPTR